MRGRRAGVKLDTKQPTRSPWLLFKQLIKIEVRQSWDNQEMQRIQERQKNGLLSDSYRGAIKTLITKVNIKKQKLCSPSPQSREHFMTTKRDPFCELLKGGRRNDPFIKYKQAGSDMCRHCLCF